MSNALQTKTFSPSEAALSVFELSKRQPQFVLKFCIIYALFAMVGIAIMAATGVGVALKDYLEVARGGGQPDPEEVLGALSPAFPGFAAFFLFNLPASVITTAMALRKAVHDREDGTFGLQFGGDEIRLLIATILVTLILFSTGFGVTVLGSLLGMGNIAVGLLASLVALIATGVIGTRLSLFGVITIDQARVSIVDSWAYTKGHVMRFMGAFLLWALISIILSLILSTIGSLVAGAMGAQVANSVPETLALFFTPGWLFYTLVSGLVSGFGVLGFVCIGAYAWHQMRGDLPVRSA